MTRLTSIYRRNARYILAVIGLTAAVVFNVDSIDIGQTLTHDADTRPAVALLADDTATSTHRPRGLHRARRCQRP